MVKEAIEDWGRRKQGTNKDNLFVKLRRWWKGVDIFQKAYILIPINEDFLKEEWCYLDQEVDISDLTVSDCWKRLPDHIEETKLLVLQQKNDYDCGLFVLLFMERFIEEAPKMLKKKEDVEANNRKVKVYGRNFTFIETRWKKLRVGDLVKVHKDEYFTADLLLLSSSYEDGICYVETMNLDGETNLKLKHALEATSHLHDENSLERFRSVIKCEDPNENLYSFVGTLFYNGREYPLSLQQMLLRDSKLKNTEYVYGVVVFTGHDTKVRQS